MYIARSMRLGGKIVYPDECDFCSYDDLKLRCIICGEPVYLRKGDVRKPYFAHFHTTNSRQVEECELRVSFYGNNTQINSLIKDRGQRLEIFEQHFLNMISVGNNKIVDDVKFKLWINSIKDKNYETINKLTQDCSQYFLTHRRQMEGKYILPFSKIKDKAIMLQQKISLEAIDYLCVKSSYKLLEYLLNYSMYKLYKDKENHIIKQNNIFNICNLAMKLVIINPWLKEFESIQDKKHYEILKQKNSSYKKIIIQPGYINGWSNPFTVQLNKDDYLANYLGYKSTFQVTLGANNTLILFSERKQIFKKILELGTVTVTLVPVYEWIATQFEYEHLAKLLNKCGKIDAKTASNYIGLFLTEETLSIKNRLLCTKKYLGEKHLIETHLNPDFIDENNCIKKGYEWLEGVRIQITSKMLQPNAKLIARKLSNNTLYREDQEKLKQAKHNLKPLMRTVNKSILQFNPEMGKKEVHELSNVITEYLICKLRLSRSDIIGNLRALTPDLYTQLVNNARLHSDTKEDNHSPKTIKQNVENYVINNSNKAILKAEHDVKKCNQYARATVRKWQPNASESDVTRLAFLIIEYIFTKLNLNKYDAIGLLQKLKHDEQAYTKLRDMVITPELGNLKEVSTLGSVY
ncbi:hypothetical protein [Nostoc sp. FACHB-145]|uniref:competence protein CoiA family protein n=1 Tax=Nostoc sp. FACHB-145 TaxID=2692836 RepID=UPI001685CCB0|nr:hypothetical protein [Nostoc sp. FACHB-145]MBD2470670.1 hypothetical protein [Nostoc sp. FACHB-145]